jgi:hypothetical protein
MWLQVFLDSHKNVSLGNLVASRTDLSLLRTELWRQLSFSANWWVKWLPRKTKTFETPGGIKSFKRSTSFVCSSASVVADTANSSCVYFTATGLCRLACDTANCWHARDKAVWSVCGISRLLHWMLMCLQFSSSRCVYYTNRLCKNMQIYCFTIP